MQLDFLIMRVVARVPVQGYAIVWRIQQMSRDALQLQQGSLYSALHRLEYQKLLSSSWQPTAAWREAKFYELTAKRRAYRREGIKNWKRLTEVAGPILMGTPEGIS